MKFRSRSTGHIDFYSPSPTGISTAYEVRLGSDGVSHLVPVGKHDLNEFVQASLEGTKVYNIIDRFALGDESVLNKVKGFYADVVGMPSSLAEAHDLMVSIDKKFAELPAKLKQVFGNSSSKFASALRDGSINEIFSGLAQENVPDQEVSTSESVQMKEGVVSES